MKKIKNFHRRQNARNVESANEIVKIFFGGMPKWIQPCVPQVKICPLNKVSPPIDFDSCYPTFTSKLLSFYIFFFVFLNF